MNRIEKAKKIIEVAHEITNWINAGVSFKDRWGLIAGAAIALAETGNEEERDRIQDVLNTLVLEEWVDPDGDK